MACSKVISYQGGTNAVEGFHRQVGKVTKTEGAFPNDMALLKLVYLFTRRIGKKWNVPLQNWGLVVQQLAFKFEGRLVLDLTTNKSKKESFFIPRMKKQTELG